MNKNLFTTLLFLLALSSLLTAEEKKPTQELFSETAHNITIQGKAIPYKATAGNLVLLDKEGKESASLFFVSYVKEGVTDQKKRPITFCFNGGPGSAAVWLNIGVFGPRKIPFSETGHTAPPYELVDNEASLLDLTDLVFIDPVSTGHSIATAGNDPKQFHGLDEDVKSIAEFIRHYLSRYQRWDSPKYLAGESYGTTRAAHLSFVLHDDLSIYLNGIIFISSVLNFQTKCANSCNDLPYITTLPSFAAAAWYHKKTANEDLGVLLKQVEEFALGDYALALLQGDRLNPDQRKKVAAKLAEFTGLTPEYIEMADLRIENWRFRKELLRNERRCLGIYDSRQLGLDMDACGEGSLYDPSLAFTLGLFTGTFNEYLQKELKWTKESPYVVLADVQPWNWGKSNQIVDVTEDLRKSFMLNPELKVFVANGIFDLATPYFATDYTFNHLNLDERVSQGHFTLHNYEGGHMMYLSKPAFYKLRKDLESFYLTPSIFPNLQLTHR